MTEPAGLQPAELRRYARHLRVPGFGEDGQRRLKAARVLVVGAGGLGSPAALYLAAAGVGTIGLVDHDVVDESNLQRQILHGTSAIGAPKLASAEARLRDLNPHVRIRTFPTRLAADNARAIVREFDAVLDGSDNFPTRYLVNDACVLEGAVDVYGAIFRFDGQVSVFGAPDGPCYRCLFRDPPPPELVPSCADAGVIGVVPGIVGSFQALETIKLLAGVGTPLVGRLLLVDGLTARTREIAVRKDPDCPACGRTPSVTDLIDYDAFCGAAVRRPQPPGDEIEPAALAEALTAGRAPVLVDVREPWEWELGRIEGAVHVPLGALGERVGGLDPARPTVAYCHTGQRSLVATFALRRAGFRDVRSLRGGIAAWAAEVDPRMGTY